MLIINRPVGFWEKGDAVHGVVMSIEIEIAGIGEVCGMGPGPLSRYVDPPVPEDEAIKPHLEDFVGGCWISPDPAGCITGRRTTERSPGSVDAVTRPVAMTIGVYVGKIGRLLPFQEGEASGELL